MSQKSSHILIALQGSQSFRQPLLEPAPGSKLLSLIRKSRAMIRDKGRNLLPVLLAFVLVLASMAMPVRLKPPDVREATGSQSLCGGAIFRDDPVRRHALGLGIERCTSWATAWILTGERPGRIGTDNELGQRSPPATVHTLALKSDGTLWAWGSNSYGQLVDGPQSTTVPTKITNAGHRLGLGRGRTIPSLGVKVRRHALGLGKERRTASSGSGPAMLHAHSTPLQIAGTVGFRCSRPLPYRRREVRRHALGLGTEHLWPARGRFQLRQRTSPVQVRYGQ